MGNSLSWLIVCFIIPFVCNLFLENIEASHIFHKKLQSLQTNDPTAQPYRTAYHFQPPRNWMNDPNGPMIYKGIYHLFYQYNPEGAVPENIVWAHSTSKDLVNWTPHPIAIFRDQKYDINGCFSGSTTILGGGKPAILYTGVNSKNEQVQNLITPRNLSDPYLIEWIKSPYNPLMVATLENGINTSQFRDPTTAWLGFDGRWRVLIGNEKGTSTGRALLYRSKDFVHWTLANHPLHFSKVSGMWECPDFFPVSVNSLDGVETSVINGNGIKHVLKISLNDVFHDSYAIGTYYVVKDVFVPEQGTLDNDTQLRYDYGKYYASKTFFDSSTKRRILWGWINESTDATININKGWAGLQGVPRKIWLDIKSRKQLVQWPVTEIETLRTNQVTSPSTLLKGESFLEISNVTASEADVEITFDTSTILGNAEVLEPSWSDPQAICSQKGGSVKGRIGPFGLLVLASVDMQEYTAIFFRIFKGESKYVVLMCSDQSKSSLHLDYDKTTYGAFVDVDPVTEKLSLRTLIDHSIVESFAGEGKACITARVYPSLAINEGAHLYAFNNGSEHINITKLNAWSMGKAHIN